MPLISLLSFSLSLSLSLPFQARAGVGSTVEVLRLFQSCGDEKNFTVWETIAGNLSLINRIASYSDFYTDFTAYAQKVFSAPAARLGWEATESDSE